MELSGVRARGGLGQRPVHLPAAPRAQPLLGRELAHALVGLQVQQAPAQHAALVRERAARAQVVERLGVGDGLLREPQPRALGHLGLGGLAAVAPLRRHIQPRKLVGRRHRRRPEARVGVRNGA